MTRLLDATTDETLLGRYELIAELASGGMATVFLARRSGVGGFQRLVAIKRLHPHLARDPEFIQMFMDEARVAARIHHPNVVPIVDIETNDDDGTFYLVMEYVEGDTAARLLAKSHQAGRRIPASVTVRIVLDVLAGLHRAHELTDDEGNPLEIVHRDVSPQNVLVGVDGTARITDFGVARAASRLSTTRTGQLKGKLAYMAPEQARGSRARVDRRADLFAVGILLWEMLAAKRLFRGDGDAETLTKILYDPIPSLRSVVPTAPPALDALCAKVLSREAEDRHGSAAELAEELERLARSGGYLAGPKDVAAHVELVLGADLAAQREALRQWVARSEPRTDGPRPKPSRPEREPQPRGDDRPTVGPPARGANNLALAPTVPVRAVTLEDRSRSSPVPSSSSSSQARRSSLPPAGEATRVEGSKPSGPRATSAAAVVAELTVSSVSSAAIAVPHGAAAKASASTPLPVDGHRRRGGGLFWAAAAAVVAAAVIPGVVARVQGRDLPWASTSVFASPEEPATATATTVAGAGESVEPPAVSSAPSSPAEMSVPPATSPLETVPVERLPAAPPLEGASAAPAPGEVASAAYASALPGSAGTADAGADPARVTRRPRHGAKSSRSGGPAAGASATPTVGAAPAPTEASPRREESAVPDDMAKNPYR